MAERLLKPRYRVAVLDLQKFEPEGIIGAFKRKGAHVSPLSGELDPGLAVDAFLSSSYGDYVYVSCNPEAFRRDYENHLRKAYGLKDAVLVDMFPHTPHVEAVVLLERV